MEPLSGVASTIAVLQLAGNLTNICYGLYNGLGARKQLDKIIAELDSLCLVLKRFARFASDDSDFAQACQDPALLEPLRKCQTELEDLEVDLKKLGKSKTPSLALTWLFKEKELKDRLDRFSSLKETLNTSLHFDEITLLLEARTGAVTARSSREDAAAERKRGQTIDWLGLPFPSSVCADAQNMRSIDTCTWLLNSLSITTWKTDPHSKVWLHGIPGCGKTVFSSAVVETLTALCQNDKSRVLAYYFFEFASQDNSAVSSFLCSLLSQIVAHEVIVPVVLQSLYHKHQEGARKPNNKELLEALRVVLTEIQHVYVVIDAVDECGNRTEVLEIIEHLVDWRLSNLHSMVTSRTDAVFEDTMGKSQQICLSGQQHRQDIRIYNDERMQKEPYWRKWSAEDKKRIAKDVVDKAEDMFRLAKLHLDDLQNCKTPRSLWQTVRVLPTTLYETYARILGSISSEHMQDAMRILGWLCFAIRPPTLSELAAAIAVDQDTLEYDSIQEYKDTDDIFGICGSLLTRSTENNRRIVKLSHASVKDYLKSDQFLRAKSQKLPLDSSRIDGQICTICLVYLKSHNYESREQARKHQADSPLIGYATSFRIEHFRRAESTPRLSGTFLPSGFHIEESTGDLDVLQTRLNTSLYCAAFIGNLDLIESLLDAGAEANGRYGVHDTLLAAATIKADLEIAKRLLQAGANADSKAGPYGTALHIAARNGFVELVDLLLSSGADVRTCGGIYHTVLYAATVADNNIEHTVTGLIQAGADVTGGRAPFDTPLSNAAYKGDEATAKLLIDANADLNDGSLHCALRKANIQMARMLIDAGASVDFVNVTYGTTFRAAAVHGKLALEFLARDIGADVHMVDEEGMNALHVSASMGRVPEVQYLLDLGLQVDTKDKKGWSAVHHAASASTPDCLELLLPFWTLETDG